LLRPLSKAEDIRDRLDGVEEFAYVTTARTTFRSILKNVHDLERLVARAVLGTSGPRDFVALASSVEAIPKLKEVLAPFQVPLIRRAVNELDEADDIYRAIKQTLVDEPPGLLREGGFIRDGVDPLIDELRGISRNAKEAIAGIEATERVRTGIGNLKVRYNRVFGYYIEVTKANLHAVPDDYERKQTIANGERYVTMALKDYERKALGADDRIFEREQQVFEQLRQMLVDAAPRLQKDAGLIAELDVLASFAETSTRKNYTKPQIHSGGELIIREGRHPVVESRTDVFVPNDVALDSLERQLVILTGPNMGGKSTYLRQTAIVVLLAHVGCFVPAREAKIPIVDQIFARIGASDNIARGQSTFMVEMQETARILNLATPQSLVLLDEIGRGTATFDGLSIAWAVAEHLVAHNSPRPKTIFATHYHELTDLADVHEGVVNQHVVAREWEDTIVFMHEVHAGRSDRSYGIQVARLAGIPQSTVDRAKQILEGLEGDELSRGGRTSFRDTGAIQDRQIGLFQQPRQERSAIAKQIDAIDVDSMTPLAALTLLSELKKNIDE
jgi:DNA mismatch repair protein MutS